MTRVQTFIAYVAVILLIGLLAVAFALPAQAGWDDIRAYMNGVINNISSSTDNAVVRWDGTTGHAVQNSVVTIADTTGNVAGVGTLNATGVIYSAAGFGMPVGITGENKTVFWNSSNIAGLTQGGHRVFESLTSGSWSAGFGADTLVAMTTGSYNSSFGPDGMSGVTTGSYNIGMGLFHGHYSNGSYGIFLGPETGVDIGAPNINTTISLGYYTRADTANTGWLGSGHDNGYIDDWYYNQNYNEANFGVHNVRLNAAKGIGTDIAGATFTIAGGKNTGAGAPGAIIFQTGITGGSSATLSALAERARIDEAGMSVLDLLTLGEDVAGGGANVAGSLKLFSAGDNAYYSTLTANTCTSNAAFTLPADEPGAESWLTMGTDGVIDYTAISTETLAAVTARGATSAQTITLTAAAPLVLGEDVAGGTTNVPGALKLWSNGDNAYYTTLTAGTQTANATYTLPVAMPAVSGYVLTSTDAGVMSWASVAEADTLATVTGREATTSTATSFTGGLDLGTSTSVAGDLDIFDAGTIAMGDDGDDTTVTIGPVADGTTTLGITGSIDVSGDVSGATIGGITEANLVDKSASETITGTWEWGRYTTYEFANDTFNVAPYLRFNRACDGDPTSDVADGDWLGDIRFWGYGSSTFQAGAYIAAVVDGAPGATATDMPSSLIFQTSPDGSATPVTRLDIGSDGSSTFSGAVHVGVDDAIQHAYIHDAGTIVMYDDSDDTSVTIGPVGDGTTRLAITGGISPSQGITTQITSDESSHTAEASEMYGNVHRVTGAYTMTLPAAVVGMSATFRATTAAALSVKAGASDKFEMLDGTALDNGDKITSDASKNAWVYFVCESANTWIVLSQNGAWIDGGA